MLKRPPNSIITKFREHKIMSFKMLIKYRLLIFMYTVFKNDKTLGDSLKADLKIYTRNINKLPGRKT